MPICSHCNLGIPPSFAVCPDCGRKLVELASVAVLEEQTEFVEIHSLAEMIDEALPDDLVAAVLPNGQVEPRERKPEPERERRSGRPKRKPSPRRVRSRRERRQPSHITKKATQPETVPEEDAPVKVRRVRRQRPKPQVRPTAIDQAPQRTPEPELEIPSPGTTHDRPAAVPTTPRRDKRARRARSRKIEPSPIEVQDEAAQPVVTAEAEDEGLDGDQFVGTGRGFVRIHRPAELRAGASTVASAHPVRWVHRAYRGEVEMSGTGSRAGATLVVFGDGLLLIGSGAPGGFRAVRGLLSGRPSARKQQKSLNLAGSSAEGESLVPGSRRVTPAEIELVRIDKGGALHRDLTIRTTSEEPLRYRFPAKRHADVAKLLSPVLGEKLFDVVSGAKAARTA